MTTPPMTDPTPKQGLILFAHGSSQSSWRAPFDDIAVRVRASLARGVSTQTVVQLAFLELMAPSVAQAIADLVQQGVRDIRIVPLFFGVGKHIAEDLRKLIAAAQTEHPEVVIQMAPALGQSEWMRQAIAEYALSTLDDTCAD